MKVLITCPPMLRSIDRFRHIFDSLGIEIETPQIVQTLSEAELIERVPNFDGWIIGDDPATERVFEAGAKGKLRAAVKWGVGVDNVDFKACHRLGLPISNTPAMFGNEVADLAMFYVTALARHAIDVDKGVKAGDWPKPVGMSLFGKKVGLVGLGDIGRNTAVRLHAAGMQIVAYDPFYKSINEPEPFERADWPNRISEFDFLVFTCSLTPSNRHMLNADTLRLCKPGVRVVNVARGPLIDENALCDALETGLVSSAALEVFEIEPLPVNARIRKLKDRCLFGSHNSSNTLDAVERTSLKAIELLKEFLGVAQAEKSCIPASQS